MTTLAPAAIAFVMSPEYLIPPSAMMGISYLSASGAIKNGGNLRHSDAGHYTGGTNGTGTYALLDAVGSRFNQCTAASAVATLPAISCKSGNLDLMD